MADALRNQMKPLGDLTLILDLCREFKKLAIQPLGIAADLDPSHGVVLNFVAKLNHVADPLSH